MSSEPTIYRITTFFKRRPDLTEDEFYHHWGNVHGMISPLKYGGIERIRIEH
jgi:hypothetical protein